MYSLIPRSVPLFRRMPVIQQAWVLVMRSRTSTVHCLKMLIHYQDNGSIIRSLVTIAHFGWKRQAAYLWPCTTIHVNKKTCGCNPRSWLMRPGFQDLFVKKLPRRRLAPIRTSPRYFEEIFLSSGFVGKRGLTSSIHMIGPMYCTSSNLIEAGIGNAIGTLGGVRP
jgi:hypothetical protein